MVKDKATPMIEAINAFSIVSIYDIPRWNLLSFLSTCNVKSGR